MFSVICHRQIASGVFVNPHLTEGKQMSLLGKAVHLAEPVDTNYKLVRKSYIKIDHMMSIR